MVPRRRNAGEATRPPDSTASLDFRNRHTIIINTKDAHVLPVAIIHMEEAVSGGTIRD